MFNDYVNITRIISYDIICEVKLWDALAGAKNQTNKTKDLMKK